jgi:flagellar assembly protein FliH
MAMANRFMFDLDFDDARNLADKPSEPTFTQDELNAARGMARAEGMEAGHAEAMRSVERRVGENLAQIAQRLGEAAAQRAASLQEIERNAVDLCIGLMRRLFPEFQRRHGSGEVEQLVRESLRVMVDEPRVVVRLNDENLDALKERITGAATAAGFAGKIVLVSDDQVPPGD